MNSRIYRMLVINHSWPGWAIPKSTLERMSRAIPGLFPALSGPTDRDPNKLIEELELLIEERVSGVILCPGTATENLIRKVNEAILKNIPIVTMYDDLPKSKRLSLIGTDEENQAYKFANKIFVKFRTNHVDRKLKTVISYMGPDIMNQVARLKGVQKAIEENKAWIELIDTVEDQADDEKGKMAIMNLLEDNMDIGLIIGLDARSAIGAKRALVEKKKKPREIMITGWDSDEDVLQAIKMGWVEAVSAQNASLMTQIAVSILEAYNLAYLYSDRQRLEEMGIAALPERINIDPFYIDKDNVDAFFRKR